ncbi:metabolite traffic protein EboE [uncultured Microbacterium sp.]|uniref:metabolite traffic protein EboE n=1 Tax=uncultured Microbacterium sp. TaxID=191216 RepID=UPI0028D66E16|nr:metabolite traffic protein EboE [uncultured Microbacterium sp.]
MDPGKEIDVDLGNGLGHLSYSTLVHAGDTWEQMRASLEEFVPRVKARVSPEEPFAVSLRMSAATVQTLRGSASERASLRAFLDENDLYLYTVNAFPYGPFKGRRVMEDVYEPDWSSEERIAYTIGVAELLAELTPASIDPSIQSAPLAFAANVHGEADIARLTTNTLRVVAHLRALEQRTGRRVKLALEPEPACYLETTDETVTFFQERIHSRAGVEELARLASIPVSEAEGAIRRYLGIVFDIGHQTVGFEDITASLNKLVDAGIPIFKLQEAAALWVERLTEEMPPQLRVFTDTIYLSQSTLRAEGRVTKYLHLGDALDAYEANPVPTELRTHFHVPVFLSEIGPFRTTRFGVEDALRLHRELPLSDHLEIETYTWDVLPEALKTGDIVDYVVRELEFVRSRLQD